MPDNFDHGFLSDAFDVILGTDYHSLVLKILTFLYNYSPFFHNTARGAVFGRLFSEHFFNLFMHWEVFFFFFFFKFNFFKFFFFFLNFPCS